MTYFYEEYESIGLNPQAIITTNSSAQDTSTTAGSYITVNGSEISYAPHASATNVVYEISFYVESLDKKCYQHLVLQHDINNNGSWSTISNYLGKGFGTVAENNYVRDILSLKFIIPAWTGSRPLRLRSATHVVNLHVKYHQITQWDGASSTTTFCNTSLLVYSV